MLLQKRLELREQTIEELQSELEGLDQRHQQALQQLKVSAAAQAETARMTEEIAALKTALAEAKNKHREAEELAVARETAIRRLQREAEVAHDVGLLTCLVQQRAFLLLLLF